MTGSAPVRYAEWRELPGRSYRLVPFLWRQARRVRWWGWIALAVAVPVGVHLPNHGLGELAGQCIIGGSSGVFMAAIRRGEVFRFVAPDPLPPDHFPVTITLTIDRVPYAKQEGLLVLDDHWLLFESDECSFSLKRSDVAVAYRQPKRQEGFWRNMFFASTGPRTIELRSAGIGLRVTQMSLAGVALASAALEERLLVWASDGIALDIAGEPIRPPVAPHPFFERIVPIGPWIGIVLPLLAIALTGLSDGKLGATVAVSIVTLPFSVYFAHQVCKRRRAMKKLAAIARSADVQSATDEPTHETA